MSLQIAREPAFASGAWVAGVRAYLPCDRRALARSLLRLGPFALSELSDYPPDAYPVTCELWRLTRGRLELGGVDQHAWAAEFAGAAARSLGARWQAASEAYARRWSHAYSSVFGDYHELLCSVPGVTVGGVRDRPYCLVIGIVADSRIARWTDAAFGFGYNKIPGSFVSEGEDQWRVRAVDGSPLAHLHAAAEPTPLAKVALRADDEILQQPWLGGLGSPRLIGSRVQRSWLAPGVQAVGARGSIELCRDLALGPSAGRYTLSPCVANERWGTVLFHGMLTRVSFPWRVSPE